MKTVGFCFHQIIRALNDEVLGWNELAEGLKWIFLLFPHYALSYCLFNMNQFHYEAEVTSGKCVWFDYFSSSAVHQDFVLDTDY